MKREMSSRQKKINMERVFIANDLPFAAPLRLIIR